MPVNNNEGMKDDDLPSDLLRLVAQDEKQILPHQEVTKAINLGTEKERREVKIRATLSPTIREKLIDLLESTMMYLHGHTRTCQVSIQTSWCFYPRALRILLCISVFSS